MKEMTGLLSDFFWKQAERYRVAAALLLYYNAIVQGVPLYFKSRQEFDRLRKRAIDEMEDFSLFGPRWQAAVARRNLEALKHA